MADDRSDSPKQETTRRDLLKTLGAGALFTLLPSFAEAFTLPAHVISRQPKGLIFLVGDGWPLGAARAMHEIRTRAFGDRGSALYSLMNDPRTVASYMGTASLSSIVTDSAPASAAWSTGVHTNNGMLATLPDGTPLTTIMELLKDQGFGTGLVTTTRVTHATPAAWVSHNTNRDAEEAIAVDYLNFQPDVLLGGGSRYFDPAKRTDHRDVFGEFSAAGYTVLRDRNALLNCSDRRKRIMGIFNSSHMSYYLDRVNNPSTLGAAEPSLPEMTALALHRLSSDKDGFIVQVEAGRIDHASHANDAWGAIMDTYEMDLTLQVILTYMNQNPNTLLIITSDHGNSGWGVNGTGPSYNDATMALQKYTPIKASLELIAPQLKNKTVSEIRDVVYQYTGFNDLLDKEVQMIFDSLQPAYENYPGDFNYLAETALGRILSHSKYGAGGAEIRRGNVGFTSNNHTAEDQIALLHGKTCNEHGVRAFIENTDLFSVMCRYFKIRFSNPTMTAQQAKAYTKTMSVAEWKRHMKLHIS